MGIPASTSAWDKKTEAEKRQFNDAVPGGARMGKIIRFVTFGTHQKNYQGKPPKNVAICEIHIELFGVPKFVFHEEKGPQPWVARSEMTYSVNEKSNLYKFIMSIYSGDQRVKDALLGGKFEAKHLIGKLITVNIEKKASKSSGKVYPNVISVGPPMEFDGIENLKNQQPENPLVLFEIDRFVKKDPKMLEEFKKLYGFEQEKVFESAEIKALGWRLDDFVEKQNIEGQENFSGNQNTTFDPYGQNQNVNQPSASDDPFAGDDPFGGEPGSDNPFG